MAEIGKRLGRRALKEVARVAQPDYHVLFLMHLETRRITLAGITRHPLQSGLAIKATFRGRRFGASMSGWLTELDRIITIHPEIDHHYRAICLAPGLPIT